MSERPFDLSRLTGYELSMLILERNCANYRKEQCDELLKKIEEATEHSGIGKTNQPNKSEPPQLSGTDFGKLPWKSYKTKQLAGPEEAAWIFSNTQDAEVLLLTLKSKDGQAKIGDFQYQLQGFDHQFISRKPAK